MSQSRFITSTRNWPVKVITLGLAWTSLLFFSCEDNAALVGFRKDPRLATRYIEIPLEQSTFQRYPVSTRNSIEEDLARILVGRASDPVLGNIEAKGFFNFSPPLQPANIDPAAIYYSLHLQLRFDYYSYGTLDSSDLKLEVFKILGSLGTDGAFYSDTQIPTETTSMGDTIFAVGPNQLKLGWEKYTDRDPTNNVYFNATVRLTGTMGQDLLNDFLTNPSIFDSFTDFTEKYPGLSITMPIGNKILGVTPVYSLPTSDPLDSKLILRYKSGADVKAIEFPIFFGSIAGAAIPVVSFSQILTDRAGTPFDGITPFQPVSTSDGKAYIQSGTGLLARYDLGKFYDYFDSLENIVINSAEMIFENTANVRPPQTFEMLLLDSTNKFRPIVIDTVIAGTPRRVNDPYMFKIQNGINALAINEIETRASIRNELTGGVVAVDQETNKVEKTILTEFFQEIFNEQKNKRRVKSFAIYPLDAEFGKTVSSMALDPSSAKLRIYYSKTLTSLP